jgi:integrase
VFVYRNKPIETINNTAWQSARRRAGLVQVRVHDLKHTFGRRLRAAGVSFEDRQDLLGHRSGRITTHYSGGELASLLAAANRVCESNPHKIPTLVILKRQAPAMVLASA